MSGKTVLVVDEYNIAKLEMEAILKDSNMHFHSAAGIDEAVNVIKDRKWEICAVVWAVNTVDFKEYDDIRRFKRKEGMKKIPVLIVSRFFDKSHIIKAIQAGAVEYVTRPFERETLEGKLCKVAGIPSDSRKPGLYEDDVLIVGFPEMLNREVKAAGRGGYQLTLLGVSVIDESNRQDTVKLQEWNTLVSKVLKTKLRDTDSVFRYSNREFIVLLPFTDRPSGDIISEKIRELLRTNALVASINQGCRSVIAAVTYPDDSRVRDRLLEMLLERLEIARGSVGE
jgi:two-component system, chemotaxis family, chemotaxis protein CheY